MEARFIVFSQGTLPLIGQLPGRYAAEVFRGLTESGWSFIQTFIGKD